MDFRQLESFIAIAKNKSFSKADLNRKRIERAYWKPGKAG